MPLSLLKSYLPDAAVLRASAWSLSGNVVPMLAAVAAVPFLLSSLGVERMGVLSLVWVFIGYFNFLDLGLGRAVTVAVARCRSDGNADSLNELSIVGTASVLLAGLGCFAAVLLGASALIWDLPVKSSSAALDVEITRAWLWMLPSLPLLLLCAVLRGHLEAVGAFRALNLVRIPSGVLLVLAPCLATLIQPDLAWVCASILLVRLWQTVSLLQVLAATMAMPWWRLFCALVTQAGMHWVNPLLAFGGWISVSNILGPVIVYADRFVIGAVVAAGAVAVYAIPFDVISRLPVLTASLAAVLLPEIARMKRQGSVGILAGDDAERLLVRRSYALSLLVLLPAVVLGVALMPWLLALWINADFAVRAAVPAQILVLAFAFNALAQIPFAALQASGGVKAIAGLHASELLPYLALLWVLTEKWGVTGAALACLLRSGVDFAALLWMYHRPLQVH